MASIDRVTNDSPGWDVEYDARSPVKRQKVAERAAKNGGKRIAILGAGGIGSVVGGLLAHAGHDVTLVDAWYEHINAVQKDGLLVQIAQREGPCKEVRTYPRAVHLKDLQAENGLFDYGFIAVNAYDTDWATALLDRYMKREGVLCCFQNGLNDERVAAVAGVDRTLGVVITISSAVYEPGVTIRTDLQDQSFKVGDIGGTDNARARELEEAQEQARKLDADFARRVHDEVGAHSACTSTRHLRPPAIDLHLRLHLQVNSRAKRRVHAEQQERLAELELSECSTRVGSSARRGRREMACQATAPLAGGCLSRLCGGGGGGGPLELTAEAFAIAPADRSSRWGDSVRSPPRASPVPSPIREKPAGGLTERHFVTSDLGNTI